MFNLDVFTVWVLHFWMLSAFTFAIAVLWWLTGKKSLKYWFFSDVAGLASLSLFYSGIENRGLFYQIAFPVAAWALMYMRILAVAGPEFIQSIQRYVFGGAAAILAVRILLFADAENANLIDASLTAAGNFFFAMLAILMIMATLRNKEWSITFGSALIMLSTALYFLISIIRGISAIYGPGVIFVDVRMADVSGSTIIIVAAVTVHIGFIVMMFEQMHRTQLNSVEQSARADEGRLQAEKRQLEVQRLSEEQKALIEVLTHEVRQPLNNASAALQSITHELDGNRAPRQMEAVLRAQSVIDNVSTALSNALVAATVLERQHKFYPARCEPVAIAQIVALDFSLSDRKRIEIEAAQAPLFMTADPILIRIALRNLFENALRYAPAGSQILIEICADETKMGVAFNVSNEETNPKWADGVDIFARRVRGANPQISGSGMGLYIAAEIAKLHNGALTTHGTDGHRIFSLFLSD